MSKKNIPISVGLLDSTIVEVVKLDLKCNFVGMKEMTYGEFKVMKKQPNHFYRSYQKNYSQYHL